MASFSLSSTALSLSLSLCNTHIDLVSAVTHVRSGIESFSFALQASVVSENNPDSGIFSRSAQAGVPSRSAQEGSKRKWDQDWWKDGSNNQWIYTQAYADSQAYTQAYTDLTHKLTPTYASAQTDTLICIRSLFSHYPLLLLVLLRVSCSAFWAVVHPGIMSPTFW